MFCRIGSGFSTFWISNDPLGERLSRLPSFDPPADGWTRLERRLDRRRRQRQYIGGGLALAASILLAAILVPLLPLSGPAPDSASTSVAAAQPEPETMRLIRVSQQLEGRLGVLRPRVAVWGSEQARQARDYQRSLELIDLQLNYADSQTAERLWRERVALMTALVELHEHPSSRYRYASYQY